MAYTLFDLTYRVARALGGVVEGLATGGTAGTLLDTLLLQNIYPDDYFNRGQVWILRDSAGGGAAPEREQARINDFAAATGTVTFTVTLTAAVAAGDRYALATDKFSLDTLISFINDVLDEILIPTTDTTSLTTAASQTEYSLPAAMRDERLEVWLQTYTSDTDDNRWVPLHGWYVQETGTGTQKLLVFHNQPPYPYALKLVYYTAHPALYLAADSLREGVDINRVVYDAAYRCLEQKKQEIGDSDPDLDRLIQSMAARAERAKWQAPQPSRKPKLAALGSDEQVIDL